MPEHYHYHYSTKCKCGNHIHWSEGQEPPACDKCGQVGNWEHSPLISVSVSVSLGACMTAPPIAEPQSESLREWWHQIIRRYGTYLSYAMILALQSDEEIVHYLKRFGKELHLITGENCLVITLTKLGFMQYGADDEFMPLAVDEHIVEGYCLQVSRLFNIRFDEFPCLLLFRDIRKPEHIKVSLKGLSAEEIAQEMRELFSVVDEAARQDKDILEAVDRHSRKQAVSEKTKAIWSGIQGFAGKTLETIMEAFVKASVK